MLDLCGYSQMASRRSPVFTFGSMQAVEGEPAVELRSGQNIGLNGTDFDISVTSSQPIRVAGVIAGPGGRARGSADFVHLGSSRDGAVTVRGERTVECRLGSADSGCERISILVLAESGAISSFAMTVAAAGAGSEAVARFFGEPEGAPPVVVAAEVYLRDGRWKIRAVGHGYADGPIGAGRDLGLDPAIVARALVTDPIPDHAAAAAADAYIAEASAAEAPAPDLPDLGAPAPSATAHARPARDRRRRGLVAPAPTGSPAAEPLRGIPASEMPVEPSGPRFEAAGSPVEPEGAGRPVRPLSVAGFPRPQAPTPTEVDPGPRESVDRETAPMLVLRSDRWSADSSSRVRRTALDKLIGRIASDVVARFPRERLAEGAAACDRSEAEIKAKLENCANRLEAALQRKYRNSLPTGWNTRSRYNESAPSDPVLWTGKAEALIDRIERSSTPVFKAARQAMREALVTETRVLLSGYLKAVDAIESTHAALHQKIYQAAFADFTADSSKVVSQALAQWESVEEPLLPTADPSTRPIWLSDTSPADVITGVGRLLFPVGTVAMESFFYSLTVSPGRPTSTVLESKGSPALRSRQHAVPYLLDLDECGGIVTNTPVVVQNLVLDMLALLPAGRMRIDVIDPVKLGASLNFLYGLGDAGAKIYGDRVWRSHNIGELLAELENHVAFVTQKYLQGEHQSLTDYNRAAGEVAEPYRVVLLFDYPRAFSRDDRNSDDEALARLQRLAQVGRRAGVFILATLDSSILQHTKPRHLEALASALTGGTDDEIVGALRLNVSGLRNMPMTVTRRTWWLHPDESPSDVQSAAILSEVERRLLAAENVQVDPAKVYQLALAEERRVTSRGIRSGRAVANPDDPDTWWMSDAAEAATTRFGRVGASNVAALQIDSGEFPAALVGGRTGSGKSVLLHSLILGWATEYSPEELELYLIDFKEGVEFKPYAVDALPHARVVAIETNRAFGISVLESLDREIERRGKLFKAVGGGEVGFGSYRRQTGDLLPRIILVIDEFHMLIQEEDETSKRGVALLERIVRQGRAFGVHPILASQSLSGSAQKLHVALDQIKVRLVLASSSKDSELLLAEGNADAQLLSKPGEGIINTKGGLREANNRFQNAYWSGDARAEAIQQLSRKAHDAGFRRKPVIFEGNAEAPIDDQPRELFRRSSPMGDLVLPIGAPMSLDDPVCVSLPRVGGANLLIVDAEAEKTLALMIAALIGSDIALDVVDFKTMAPMWADAVRDMIGGSGRVIGMRQLPDLLNEYEQDVKNRILIDDRVHPSRVLVLPGLQRARDFDPDDYDDGAPAKVLTRILRDGADVGVHVIAWADRLVTLERRLDRAALRDFSHKLLGPMNEGDSRTLGDSAAAASVTASQYVYDDFDSGRQAVARRFSVTKPEQLLALARDDGGQHHG